MATVKNNYNEMTKSNVVVADVNVIYCTAEWKALGATYVTIAIYIYL